MHTAELEIDLRKIKSDSKLSVIQKIKTFYSISDKNNIEPIVLRLSGYIKSKLVKTDYLFTFTPKRLILLKKSKLKKITDPGYVAGLGPYLYYILSDKVKFSDIKIKDSFISEDNLIPKSDEMSIDYPDIKKIIFYPDTKTFVSNMFGSAVKESVLKIHTMNNLYEFVIPTGKNGPYQRSAYWLKMCLPVTVSNK